MLRNLALRAGLELAVLEDREVDAADAQAREIDGDAAFDRRRIDRIGQMPRLLPLHHVHVLDRIEVAAVGVVLDVASACRFRPTDSDGRRRGRRES